MNRLNKEQRTKIIAALVEGNSLRATARMCDVAFNTVLKLLPETGRRLTNGFSKKVENHMWALALHYMHYNFCRIHQTLRVTPAMEAGVAEHVWAIGEVADMV